MGVSSPSRSRLKEIPWTFFSAVIARLPRRTVRNHCSPLCALVRSVQPLITQSFLTPSSTRPSPRHSKGSALVGWRLSKQWRKRREDEEAQSINHVGEGERLATRIRLMLTMNPQTPPTFNQNSLQIFACTFLSPKSNRASRDSTSGSTTSSSTTSCFQPGVRFCTLVGVLRCVFHKRSMAHFPSVCLM